MGLFLTGVYYTKGQIQIKLTEGEGNYIVHSKIKHLSNIYIMRTFIFLEVLENITIP